MGIVKEFKEFAMRGNVIDLAVGVVIGTAFGKIVSSLVADIVMPPLNLLTMKSGVDFKGLAATITTELPEKDAEGVTLLNDAGEPIMKMVEYSVLNYGSFIQAIVDFIIVAIAIFLFIKFINSMKKKEEAKPAEPAAPSEDVLLLREIRDSLNKNAPRRVD